MYLKQEDQPMFVLSGRNTIDLCEERFVPLYDVFV